MSGAWDAGRLWRERHEHRDRRPYATAHTTDGALVAEASLPGGEPSVRHSVVTHLGAALDAARAPRGPYVVVLRDHTGEPMITDRMDYIPSPEAVLAAATEAVERLDIPSVVEHTEVTALETRDDGVHAVTTEVTIIGPRSILRPPEPPVSEG